MSEFARHLPRSVGVAANLPDRDDVAYVADAWFGLCRRYDVEVGNAVRLFGDLLISYSENDRCYHDLRHICECLEVLEANAALAHDLDALRWALFFHDAVYDTRVDDGVNVAASADLAVESAEEAGLPYDLAYASRRLVMATTHSDAALDGGDERLIADVDLVVLARPWKVFCEYGDRIRREYSWASDAEYRKGRAAFFERMLAMPRIYLTDSFRDLYEEKARANMSRALAEIRTGS